MLPIKPGKSFLNDLREGLTEGVFAYEDESIAFDLVLSCTIGAMRAVVEGRPSKDTMSVSPR